jgi:hypothetical protein
MLKGYQGLIAYRSTPLPAENREKFPSPVVIHVLI